MSIVCYAPLSQMVVEHLEATLHNLWRMCAIITNIKVILPQYLPFVLCTISYMYECYVHKY